jgi:hypothetical protein
VDRAVSFRVLRKLADLNRGIARCPELRSVPLSPSMARAECRKRRTKECGLPFPIKVTRAGE